MKAVGSGATQRGYERKSRQWNKFHPSQRFEAPPKANRFELAHGLESGDAYLHHLGALGRTLSAEQKLLLACLADALRCLRDGAEAREVKGGHALWVDAIAWFTAPESSRLFSFHGVCENLGIDTDFVLRYARRWM